MKRRDIIIIAVLINAGLLVVLFTSALKSDRSEPAMVMETQLQAPVAQPQAVALPQVKGDEVDQVLSQFAATNAEAKEGASQNTVPLVQAVAVAPRDESNFLSEVQALSAPFETPAPTAQEKPAAPAYKEVKVKKGDALEKIARANRTSVQEIMRLNKLNSTQLKIGQVLKVPTKDAKQSFRNDAGDSRIYIVKNGDNPWTIAVKNHMKLEDLLQLNNLDEERARKLKPGDQLRIR
jgi:peptidoglycan endopeptidase LytF